MSLRNRIGAFFLLGAAIFLFIFVTSVFSPTGDYALLPLFGGVALLFVGWRWRLAKSAGGPPRSTAPAPAGTPPPPPPKKRGPLASLLKGPPSKMPPKAPGGPGSNAPAGAKGGGGGKPGGGKPGGGGGKPRK